jgi:serine/threonine protein kinase/lipoprotein NlpI
MTSLDAAHGFSANSDLELDKFVAAFEAAYVLDSAADLDRFLPPIDHPRYADVLCELVRVDLEFAWDRGEERRVESYRDRFPALFRHATHLAALIHEEIRLRRASGETPDPAEYAQRFGPGWEAGAPRLGSGGDPPASGGDPPLPPVTDTVVVEALADPGRSPEPGEVVAGFRLTSELGRGSFARVFLARQVDLADRPIVVKVSAKFPGESQTLARLQHTSIVPVYSVHQHGRFHVVCMPFLGATTLADLLNEFHNAGRFPASAHVVAGTLSDRAARTADSSEDGLSNPAGSVRPAPPFPPAIRELYARSSYVELVLWLGVELADGLAHAHARGILHRDVKPANVLLTDEGRPMLLDFNLAADEADRTQGQGNFGGTLRYMAPEQLAALRDRAVRPDARADVYALALVLFELLAGRLPFPDPTGPLADRVTAFRDSRQQPPSDLRTLRPDASPAVAAILRKALDPEPARRYQSAADLREDLQRQLDHQPLRFAPDRSPTERLRKWARRHPRLSSWITVTLLALTLLAATVGVFLMRQRHFERVAAENAVVHLAGVRDEVRGLLQGRVGPVPEIREAIRRCDAVLDGDPTTSLQPLSPEQRKSALRTLAEVAFYRARASELLALRAPEPAEKHRNLADALAASNRAWDWHDEAKDGVRPIPVEIRGQRARLLRQLGRTDEADEFARELKAPTAERGPRERARAALPALIAAGATEAGRWEYWLHLGKHYLLADEPAAARSHFTVAAELAPESPWPHYYAGLASLESKDYALAVVSFDRVLARTTEVPEAYLNRALARIGAKDYRGAIKDLDTIEPEGRRLPRLYFVRETARRLSGDATGANRDRAAGLLLEPTDALGWNARGEAKLALTPPDATGALADFRTAVTVDPDQPQGYENQATVLAGYLNRPLDAIAVLDRTVERFPEYSLGRSSRGVLLARLGKVEAARQDAEAVLARQPTALICYQAGCVYLLTAKDPADRARGLALLRQALRQDPTWCRSMPGDPDLKMIWNAVEFRKLLDAAAEMSRTEPQTP